MAHQVYRIGTIEVPSVTQVMSKTGISIDYSRIPSQVLDTAAARGTAVHQAIADALLGIQESDVMIPDDWQGYMDAYGRWADKFKPEGEMIERSLASVDWRYGGTFDFYGRVGKGRLRGPAIIDWKTRDIVRADGIQLAAYQHLLAENEPSRRDEILAAKRIGVGFAKDGRFKAVVFKDEGDIEVFRAAVIVYQFSKRWGRG